MKRLLFLLVLMTLLLGLAAAPALAVPVDNLTALAQYFKAQSPLYIALRTDDAYIDALDRVLGRFLSKLPSEITSQMPTLRGTLNMAAISLGYDDFASGIRPWLGDTAALGLLSADERSAGLPAFVLAARITDRAAVTAFWTDLFERTSNTVAITESAAFTVIEDEPGRPETGVILITDDTLLIGNTPLEPLLLTRDARLNQSPAFTGALANLPQTDYNILLYLDLPTLATLSGGQAAMLEGLVGPVAAGLTLLDDRSLVADVAVQTGNLSALGFSPSLTPIDLDFAAHLPADASFVVQGTDLKGAYDSVIAALSANAPQQDIEQQLNQLRFGVRGLTGLEWDSDVIGWMTGDYAIYLTLDTDAVFRLISDNMMFDRLPVEFGLVVEAADAAKARALAAGLGRSLTQMVSDPSVTISQEQIGGAEATVLSTLVDEGSGIRLEIVIAANDRVLVIATRPSAEAILSGAPGLNTTAAFAEASAYVLPGSQGLAYTDGIGGGGLPLVIGLALLGPTIGDVFENIVDDLNAVTPSADELATRDAARMLREEMNRQMLTTLRALTQLVSSSSISSATRADGVTITRAVLTLAE